MSAYQHRKQGNVDWRSVFITRIFQCHHSFCNIKICRSHKREILQVAFALFVLAAAIRMLTEGEKSGEEKFELRRKPKMIGLIGVGFAAGVVSALAGIGGGVFTIPMMYYILNMPLKLAIGPKYNHRDHCSIFSNGLYLEWNRTSGSAELEFWLC